MRLHEAALAARLYLLYCSMSVALQHVCSRAGADLIACVQATVSQLHHLLHGILHDLGPGGCMAPGTNAAGASDYRLEGRLGLGLALVVCLQAFHLTVAGGQLLVEHLLTSEMPDSTAFSLFRAWSCRSYS